jgi:hypothetical protein
MTLRTYVTTSIPYVNAPPHVGHALELVQADAVARYNRLIGRQTVFQTGTDENAFKNVDAARKRGVPTQQLVDENSGAFRRLCEALGISNDHFIRTTEDAHRRGVVEFWRRLAPGDVYKAKYRGLYCTGCEDFYLEKDLVRGVCPDHGRPPSVIEEENYFFRLSTYQDRISELLESDRLRVVPASRRNEALAFVKRGLRDFSISRDAARAGGWGIPVPGDPAQVIYVWVDALINYVSGPGFGTDERWREVWNERSRKVHVIGKNVWKFHAVYWPALLLSAGLPLPDEVVVHGFVTVDGQKIGKSLGNAVDPLQGIRSGRLPLLPPEGNPAVRGRRLLRRAARAALHAGSGERPRQPAQPADLAGRTDRVRSLRRGQCAGSPAGIPRSAPVLPIRRRVVVPLGRRVGAEPRRGPPQTVERPEAGPDSGRAGEPPPLARRTAPLRPLAAAFSAADGARRPCDALAGPHPRLQAALPAVVNVRRFAVAARGTGARRLAPDSVVPQERCRPRHMGAPPRNHA